MVKTDKIQFNTSGTGDIINLTDEIQSSILKSDISSGTVTIFAPGSTTGLTTIEYEPGLLKDMPQLMEKLVPSDKPYEHDKTWHDGNGFSHLRSALIGPDITIPFASKKLTIGKWQQVVFLEFDNKPRNRTVILQIIGD